MIKIGGSGGGSFFGGGSYGESDVTEKLENIAREELQKPAPVERRKVFISFQHDDKQLVEFLRGQAKSENSKLDFIDMSLQVPFNSENAEYIRQGTKSRIQQCSVTTVMVTDKTHQSDWVNWEIRESIKLGKGVVVIDKRSNTSAPMPAAINENESNVKIVPWKHKEIMDAINEQAEKR